MFVPLNKDNMGNLCYKIPMKIVSTELQLEKLY